MSFEKCYFGICFIQLDMYEPKFFGFSEFLTGLAFMILAWTNADVRYRFRIETAFIPLRILSFWIISLIGVLTLLTDLWRAEQWWVPSGNLLTHAAWQAMLGALFFFTFFIWMWFAFIKPSKFGKLNKKCFFDTLYKYIFRASPRELVVVADEIINSARAIVSYAPEIRKREHLSRIAQDKSLLNYSKVEVYANKLLLLIADRRFCRAIVESSPLTALMIFQEVSQGEKYGISIQTFAKNLINEALTNKDSFLHHEVEGYESGLIGYHKPFTQTVFANYPMVEAIGTMLHTDISTVSKWYANHWEAYYRLVLTTFQDYADKHFFEHSYVLYNALYKIQWAMLDLYKLNGLTNISNSDEFARLGVIVKFIKDVIKILNKKSVPNHFRLRVRDKDSHSHETFFDHIASALFEVIFAASTVKSSQEVCWRVQHNSVWDKLFNAPELEGPASKIIQFKVRRLLYDEIVRMECIPDYIKGARILAFCLNVMDFRIGPKKSELKDSYALHKVILAWTKKNYSKLHADNSSIADACLVDSTIYDAENHRLIKTHFVYGKPRHIYFEVDPLPIKKGLIVSEQE